MQRYPIKNHNAAPGTYTCLLGCAVLCAISLFALVMFLSGCDTEGPIERKPTARVIYECPTQTPAPVVPTALTTRVPPPLPTRVVTQVPTLGPTKSVPSAVPTGVPTSAPTIAPTRIVNNTPTRLPTTIPPPVPSAVATP